MYTEDELLPLSGLSHMAFCERRWALIHIERQWEENTFTAEGRVIHEKAHSSDIESRPRALIRRTLPLHSFALGLSGQADIVEFYPCSPREAGVPMPKRSGLWKPYPVEYKRSRDKAGRLSYRIQLCAQAMCLEEMLGVPVPEGAVFDNKTRRRQIVEMDLGLRASVERLSVAMQNLSHEGITPPPFYAKKCDSCSLFPVCLPKAIEGADASAYLMRSVVAALKEHDE
jgi:CRISPR-associated exonuclease Cas4